MARQWQKLELRRLWRYIGSLASISRPWMPVWTGEA